MTEGVTAVQLAKPSESVSDRGLNSPQLPWCWMLSMQYQPWTAVGPDGLYGWVLKKCAEAVIPLSQEMGMICHGQKHLLPKRRPRNANLYPMSSRGQSLTKDTWLHMDYCCGLTVAPKQRRRASTKWSKLKGRSPGPASQRHPPSSYHCPRQSSRPSHI